MSDQNKTKNKKEKLSHLKNAAKVSASKSEKGLLGGFIGIGVVIFIFTIMLFGGHNKHPIEKQPAGNTSDNNFVLEQNERQLDRLQNKKNQPIKLPQLPILQNNQDNKVMVARRNAPTQMFNLSGGFNIPPADNNNPATTLTGDDSFAKFANSQNTVASTVTGSKIAHPRYTVAEGEFIHATLETAINSDLPGMVRAVTTNPIYAYIGEAPLIPAGSRLIGQYTSMTSNGGATSRVFVIWNRIVTPDGISIMINSPGSDNLGRAGIGADSVNTHFIKMFGTATLLSVLGASTATSGVGSYDQPNSSNMYRQSIASAFQQAAQNSLSQNLSIKPTLNVHQGNQVNVFVAHDLSLYNVMKPTS